MNKGISDAGEASSYAKSIGQPAGSAIYFTVDYDAQPGDMAAILSYFAGVRQGLDKSYHVGAYGSYAVVESLYSRNAADFYWQTNSWSRGNIAPFIEIHQYQYNVILAGVQVDYDHFTYDAGSWGKEPSQPSSSHGTGHAGSPSHASHRTPPTYTVRPSDTLSGISAEFGTTVEALVKINGLKDPNLIYIGQILKLSPDAAGGKSGHEYYTVKPGDTLSQIAITFGSSLAQLQAWNNIKDPNYITVGERIRVK